MTLMEKVLKAAEPHIKDKGITVTDGVAGLNFAGVQLSNGNCHFVYMMRETLPSGDLIFPYAPAMIGKDAWEVAQWALTGAEDLQRSFGVAVLNACSPYFRDPEFTGLRENPREHVLSSSQYYNGPGKDSGRFDFYDDVSKEDVLGVVGYMPPIVNKWKDKVKELIVFDRVVDMQGRVEGYTVTHLTEETNILPRCTLVTVTGTSMINHTTDDILSYCTNARDVLLTGFSLPFYPEAYVGSGIGALSCVYFEPDSAALFKPLSLAAGRDLVHTYGHGVYLRIAERRY
ncbi:MAG: DUF364 domain-containing protein [Clostridia bacterium]|nr:DUF364 domain-containing protein [Clostridia bacterium]